LVETGLLRGLRVERRLKERSLLATVCITTYTRDGQNIANNRQYRNKTVLAELKEHYLCVYFVILLFSEAVYCRLTLVNIGIKVFELAALKEH
jgi:hypothetical protein